MALTWSRSIDWDSDDWRDQAACRDTDPDLFFPVGTTGPAIEQIESAKAVCRECEAQSACLEFALDDQPGVRDLGRHLRGGAPQAAQGLAGPPAPGVVVSPDGPCGAPSPGARAPALARGATTAGPTAG